MKRFVFIVLLLIFGFGEMTLFAQQNMGVGTLNPDPSAMLEVQSLDKGLLMPRLTTTQKLSILSPATGLLVYDLTTGTCWYFDGIQWVEALGPQGPAGVNGTNGSDGIDGAIGPTGPTGLTGAAGPIGLTGPAGANGTNGSNGIDGAIGPTGPTGLTGAAGSIGLTGPAGANGANGINGVDGAIGPTGPTGLTGADGPIGLTGPAGANGIDGAIGPTGPTGLTGAAGSIGLTGPAGTNGIDGVDGAIGPTGPIGLTGPAGADGTNGVDGVNGIDGPIGPTGPTGPLMPGTIGQTINHNGTNWQATSNLYNDPISNNIGVGTTTPSISFQINDTDAIGVPSGTTGQRPALPVPTGAMRWNTTLGAMEVYTGTAWMNINTPPIGATYVQWFNAADPNIIYPGTVWASSDIVNGSFLRARGGDANVAAAAALTGVAQADAFQDHGHTATGSTAGAGVLNTSASGIHNHNWGGWWSNDDSRDYTIGNGDGNGNTLSDATFWWGGNPGTTGNPNSQFVTRGTTAAGIHSHGGSTSGSNPFAGNIYIPYDDNLSANVSNLSLGSNPSQCGGGWDGRHTAGNFMGRLNDACMNHNHTINADGNHSHTVDLYAHRHFIKQRVTSDSPSHTHTIADHTHATTVTVGTANSGTTATETRPDNVAVIFWRRTN